MLAEARLQARLDAQRHAAEAREPKATARARPASAGLLSNLSPDWRQRRRPAPFPSETQELMRSTSQAQFVPPPTFCLTHVRKIRGLPNPQFQSSQDMMQNDRGVTRSFPKPGETTSRVHFAGYQVPRRGSCRPTKRSLPPYGQNAPVFIPNPTSHDAFQARDVRHTRRPQTRSKADDFAARLGALSIDEPAGTIRRTASQTQFVSFGVMDVRPICRPASNSRPPFQSVDDPGGTPNPTSHDAFKAFGINGRRRAFEPPTNRPFFSSKDADPSRGPARSTSSDAFQAFVGNFTRESCRPYGE